MNILTEVAESIEPLLSDVISAFISHPKELRIECARMGGLLQFNIDGHPNDLPKIKGSLGKNLAALYTLFGRIARQGGLDVRLELADRRHERSRTANQTEFVDNPDWPRTDFTGLLQDVLDALCQTPPTITEEIVQPRQLRFGTKVLGSEESIFYIKPYGHDLRMFDIDLEVAIEVLFRAIGQQQGRRITISFTNAQQGSS